MSTYQQQVHCRPDDIDLDFWQAPQGVTVPDDELSFLLVPDAGEAMAVFRLSQQVHLYQRQHATQGKAFTLALMVTMGGMLPGILLYDHLVQGRSAGTPPIEFDTLGVSLYKGPNERYDNPKIQRDTTIAVEDQTVLLIDDLSDRGDTLKFLTQFIADKGARQVLTLALYVKPLAMRTCPIDFFFGEIEQDTWIITPRETVETMIKRVPVWKERGATRQECNRRLVSVIGYPAALVDYYLPTCFNGP